LIAAIELQCRGEKKKHVEEKQQQNGANDDVSPEKKSQ
jgi:hypothetical protein